MQNLREGATGETGAGHVVSKELLRDAFSMFPAGVTVLSAFTPEGPHGTTVSAFASLSMEPPMVMTALAKTSTLLGHIRDSRRFGVNYLSAGQEGLAGALASSKKDCSGLEWAQLEGVPVLRDCSVVLSVRADSIHDAGDHELIWGEIEGVSIGNRELRPLVYHARNFATLTYI
jgi:flavin reductase (DIM6/NTAB) family NADH-FMN oxidoreductase RutF